MKAALQRRTLSEPTVPLAEPALLRIGEICRWLKISKPTFWRLRRESDFPTPIAITDRVIGWHREEIESWLETRRRSAPR